MIVITLGSRRVAVDKEDDTAFQYRPTGSRFVDVAVGDPCASFVAARATVEIERVLGGIGPQRAVLGGSLQTSPGATAKLEVLTSDTYQELVDATSTSQRSPTSMLDGTPLTRGLPDEFVAAILCGLAKEPHGKKLPPGLLRIDRAAFDEVHSSAPAFELAARTLRLVLQAMLEEEDFQQQLRDQMLGW